MYVCLYVCMYVCMYVCVYEYMYVCMYGDNEGCQFIYLSNKLYLPNILCYEAKTFIKERMAYQNAVVY